MRTKLLVVLLAVFCLHSCQDWGETDPLAGNQQKPTLKELATYSFDDLGTDVSVGVYQGGKAPKLVVDKQLEVVLELDGGYVSYPNPLQFNSLQEAGSLTGWVKLNKEDENTPVFCLSDETGSRKLMFTANSDLYYNEEKLNKNSLLLTAGEWHWFSVAVKPDGCAIYIDGEAVDGTLTEDAPVATASRAVASGEAMSFMSEASRLYFGYGSKEKPVKMWIDEVSVYKNLITEKEVAKPNLPDTETPSPQPTPETDLPEAVYFNDFEGANEGCTIHGSGSFTSEGGAWGKVFRNGGGAQRTHYLQLPEDVLSHSTGSKEMTIGVWVNAKNTTEAYNFAPLFMAYGSAPVNNENTFPMFACQYRGLLQINCAGYTDFTAEQNTKGANTEYNENNGNNWLADNEWHYYTVVLTETNAKVYFDGEIKNEWNVTGSGDGNVIGGLFSNGSDLKYICLGGNQAWNWADNDAAFMFDDIVIYNQALTDQQIKAVMSKKTETPSTSILSEAVYFNDFEGANEGCTIHGSGSFTSEGGAWGKVFRNGGGAQRTHYLQLPEDVLSHSTGSKEMTIGVWVNAKNTTEAYNFAPLFMAYGSAPVNNENTFPMFACQYRGLLQINCAGYTDFTAEQNTKGANTEYNENNGNNWLADNEWHYYTVVLTETNAKVYFDGEIKNEWNVTGSGDGNVIGGLFSNGSDLKYICLGGNQAWNWGDNDAAFMLDDIAIFNKALTVDDILSIVKGKQ